MFWDDLVRRWRHETPALDRRLMQAAAGNVAVYPAPSHGRRRGGRWLLAIAIVGAVVALFAIGHGTAAALPI